MAQRIDARHDDDRDAEPAQGFGQGAKEQPAPKQAPKCEGELERGHQRRLADALGLGQQGQADGSDQAATGHQRAIRHTGRHPAARQGRQTGVVIVDMLARAIDRGQGQAAQQERVVAQNAMAAALAFWPLCRAMIIDSA